MTSHPLLFSSSVLEPDGVSEGGGVSGVELDLSIIFSVWPLGEGLGFPEDHWSDADAVLEDHRRGAVQGRASQAASQR